MTLRGLDEVLPEHLRMDRLSDAALLTIKEMIDDEVERRSLLAATPEKPE